MKVLIFMTQFYQLNGAERLAVQLAEELNQRGIHADILSMYTDELPGVNETKDSLLGRGIPAVHFLGMQISPSIISVITAVLKLRSLIRAHNYDIVETSMTSPTVIAALGTLGIRTRHVVGLHRVFMRKRENKIIHKFLRLSIRYNKRIRYYAISDYAAKAWVEYSKTSPRLTRRIYNSIADDFFKATPDRSGVCKELGLPEDGLHAIFVGRIIPFKGLDTLFEALGPIMVQHNIYLLVVGVSYPNYTGTKELLETIHRVVEQNHCLDRVLFLGYRKDIPRLMASSDILIHPSRIEGFGLTLAEAMAAGLPIVTTNVEGIPEVIAGTDSIMVPAGDPIALRDAVLAAIKRKPEESIHASALGRERAQDFRMVARVDAMITLFEDILSNRV